MDTFFERLIVRAATIDELLSDDFEALPGQKGDADPAARRLAAWCQSCASGDWLLFARRLERDRLSMAEALARFATVRRRDCAPVPAWIHDAIWIEAALQSPRRDDAVAAPGDAEPCPFEHLFTPVVDHAGALLWAGIGGRAAGNLTEARARLPAPRAAQASVQPCRAGNLRALRRGTEETPAARARRSEIARRRTTTGSSPT